MNKVAQIKPHRQRSILSAFLLAITAISPSLHSQTTSTGALAGVTLDRSAAELPGVILSLIQRETGRTESATSDEHGRFSFLLLPPGTYQPQASKSAFDSLNLTELHISPTETLRLELRLQLATHREIAMVSSRPAMVQTDTAALGRMVDENSVSGLPLVTRNFAQITGLSPGVTVGVYNAGEFGLGGTALSQIAQSNDGIFAHGSRSYDNNFQMDGISVSDVQGSAGGVAEFLYRILTVSRSSKYRQDSTTLFMDVMPVPTSA